MKTPFQQSKEAHTLTIDGYKEQPTTLTQAVKRTSFWSIKKAVTIFK